ncbi:MAG: N-acetylmuramoyl-L-alanine amidase, partial [Alphaproteobacteria bacterium]|nr:N-acetylmuramoyl-L-alanine amidase [Alphaproteobacteria bacterium]
MNVAVAQSANVGGNTSAATKPSSINTTIHDLRIGVHGEKTRLVMDMDAPVRFSTLVLANPYRVVLDLPEVRFKLPANSKSIQTGGVAGYRFGLFEPGTSRVVIDLLEPRVVSRAFLLPPEASKGHRLVIDLRKVGRTTFLAASKDSKKKWMVARRQVPRPKISLRPKPRSSTSARARKVIVLDPGHGGVDPGAIAASGTYEKTVVLAAAKTLKRVLEKTGRYDVVLTRDDDRFLRLRERVAVSRSADADLFISIHADSIADKRLRGASIYTLSEQSSDKE